MLIVSTKYLIKLELRLALLDGYIPQLDTMVGYTTAHKAVPQIFVPLQLGSEDFKLLGSFLQL